MRQWQLQAGKAKQPVSTRPPLDARKKPGWTAYQRWEKVKKSPVKKKRTLVVEVAKGERIP